MSLTPRAAFALAGLIACSCGDGGGPAPAPVQVSAGAAGALTAAPRAPALKRATIATPATPAKPPTTAGPPGDDGAVMVTVAANADGDKSRSIGHPGEGKLVGGVQLEAGRGHRVQRPERAFGTENVVYDLLDAIDAVRRKHPGVHKVLIGDLSLKAGGPLPPHHSHQSGRDVDIGLYFHNAPPEGLDHFPDFDDDTYIFDPAPTWTLVTALIGPDVANPKVKKLFMSWEAQEALRRYAARQGVPTDRLNAIFQAGSPRGRAKGGTDDDAPAIHIITHVEGHRGHLHVRFACDGDDAGCRDVPPEPISFRKARRKCVKRRTAAAKAKSVKALLAGGDDGLAGLQARAKKADVFCFIESGERE